MKIQIEQDGYVPENRGPLLAVLVSENELVDVIRAMAITEQYALYKPRFTWLHDELKRQLLEYVELKRQTREKHNGRVFENEIFISQKMDEALDKQYHERPVKGEVNGKIYWVCKKCRNTIEQSWKYCANCGQRIGWQIGEFQKKQSKED
jgi:hypothetical protein